MHVTDDAHFRQPESGDGRPGGLLRVCVRTSPAGHTLSLGDLRAPHVADVLFRIAELEDLQVVNGCVDNRLPGGQTEALARAAARLNIHPPAVHTPDAAYWAPFGGPVDAHVLAHPSSARVPREGCWSRLGTPKCPAASVC